MGAAETLCDPLTSEEEDATIYARVWQFVARKLRLRPRAASCPNKREARANAPESPRRRRRPRCLSDDRAAEWRDASSDPQWSRVAMLRQVEAVHAVRPDERARHRRCYYVGASPAAAAAAAAGGPRARVQGKCLNCGALFFRALAGAQALYCGRDCQSSSEYRRLVQDAVDAHELRAGSAVTAPDAWGSPCAGGIQGGGAIAITRRRAPAF